MGGYQGRVHRTMSWGHCVYGYWTHGTYSLNMPAGHTGHTGHPMNGYMSGVVNVLFHTLCGGCLVWYNHTEHCLYPNGWIPRVHRTLSIPNEWMYLGYTGQCLTPKQRSCLYMHTFTMQGLSRQTENIVYTGYAGHRAASISKLRMTPLHLCCSAVDSLIIQQNIKS